MGSPCERALMRGLSSLFFCIVFFRVVLFILPCIVSGWYHLLLLHRSSCSQAALVFSDTNFQHIIRLANTNVDGREKIIYALTAIKGVGRRFSALVCKKADIDVSKRCSSFLSTLIFIYRAGELTPQELEKIMTVIQHPRQFQIPNWFLNRQKDIKDGKYTQLISNNLDSKLREDLERLKKIRVHRGLRHFWGLRVRGQHTKTTGNLPSSLPLIFFQVAEEEPSVCPRRREDNFALVWQIQD